MFQSKYAKGQNDLLIIVLHIYSTLLSKDIIVLEGLVIGWTVMRKISEE